MSRIYISYSQSDNVYVASLSDALRELGHEPFVAHESLAAGEEFQSVLSRNLLESDAIAFIISEQSSASRYVMAEIGAALGYHEERGRPALFPVIIDDSGIPDQLSHIQALFSAGRPPEDVALQLAAALERLAGRSQAKAERQREEKARVEESAAVFIKKSLEELRRRESHYRVAAYVWYGAAFVSLALGLGVSLHRVSEHSADLGSWQVIVGFAVFGAVILGMLVAVARFAFMLGKSFMVESLRNSDRIHAISFGEFYLNAFSDEVDWTEVKDAFQHWNIDKGSSFIGQSPADFDNEVFKTAVLVAEALAKKSRN